MDEIYHGYRISIALYDGRWSARISHVRGQKLAIAMTEPEGDSEQDCLASARRDVDRYLHYLKA